MKNSWIKTFRRLAATSIVVGSAAFSSAMCYAQLAFDSASDPVYNDGWQAGDNGGSGFTPWNFDSSYVFNNMQYAYAHPGFKAIDNGLQSGTHFSNPFNNIGRAWTLGSNPNDDGASRAGRGFSPLQIGQTFKVVIDNPTQRQFFKGYFIRLNGGTGGVKGNICNPNNSACSPGGTPVPKMRFQTFEYFTNGNWAITDSGSTATTLFDTNTAAAGAEFTVKRTGAETYDVRMNPIGPPPAFTASRTFASPSTRSIGSSSCSSIRSRTLEHPPRQRPIFTSGALRFSKTCLVTTTRMAR